jgi:hypothetical protein
MYTYICIHIEVLKRNLWGSSRIAMNPAEINHDIDIKRQLNLSTNTYIYIPLFIYK